MPATLSPQFDRILTEVMEENGGFPSDMSFSLALQALNKLQALHDEETDKLKTAGRTLAVHLLHKSEQPIDSTAESVTAKLHYIEEQNANLTLHLKHLGKMYLALIDDLNKLNGRNISLDNERFRLTTELDLTKTKFLEAEIRITQLTEYAKDLTLRARRVLDSGFGWENLKETLTLSKEKVGV